MSAGWTQTEIGPVPEDWEVVALGDLFTFKNGLNKAKEYFGHGTPIVNYMDVFGSPGLRMADIDGLVDVSRSEREAYAVRQGDVLFTRTSETVEEVGIAATMLDAPEDTVFSGFVLRARPTDRRLLDDFKAYCFRADYFRRQVVARATYTTRALTNGRALSACSVLVPPLPEQRAIAGVLGDVDGLIGALGRLIGKKRDLAAAARARLLTGQTRLPGFTAPWQTRRLGDHVQFLRNGIQSRAQLSATEPVRYLHYGDIHVTTLIRLDVARSDLPRLSERDASRLSRLETGDLVFVDASEDLTGVGKSVEIVGADGIASVAGQHTIAARFDKAVLADGFKGYLQFIPSFGAHLRRLAAGTKVYATNRRHIASVEIPLPDLPEQTAIAAVLSDMEAEIAALEARLAKARVLKQALMQALLTGRRRLPLPYLSAPESAHA